MGVVGTLINAFVVVAVGAFLTYVTLDRHRQLRRELKGDITRLEASLAAQRQELKGDIARADGGIARLEARMDAGFNAVRSDITALALAVGARAPRASGQP